MAQSFNHVFKYQDERVASCVYCGVQRYLAMKRYMFYKKGMWYTKEPPCTG